MNRLKKIICVLLLLAMTVSMLPNITMAFSVTTPSLNVTSSKYFSALPGVYEMGDGYAVIWATSFRGTGYIKYTYKGQTYTVYDQRNGIVRTGDSIHVVKVPYEHLQGNSYTVYSTEVTSHSFEATNYGTTISAGPITLKKYDGGTEDFDMLVLTDTHSQLNFSKTIAAQFGKDPDLVVFSGDIQDSLETKNDIINMFNIMGSVTGGRYPIVYARGNHETRGVYSTTLLEYFPTETGGFYYDFRYGPLWGVVLDTAEDKVDTSYEYGNLANFTEYRLKQEAWLRSLRMDETADYRFGIYHIPRIHDLTSVDYTDSIGHLGLQVAVGGHYHNAGVYNKADTAGQLGLKIQHDAFMCGSYEKKLATFVTLDKGDQAAYFTVKTDTGASGGYNNYPVAFCDYVGPIPEPLEEPDYGTSMLFNPTTSSAGTISIDVPPTVFETGGDWYNVVWTTSHTSSTGKGMTGYVEYEYNGKLYQQYDEAAGYRRSCDSFHTVKVPKEHLNNNTYKVGSFLVEYAYRFPNNVGRYYVAGDWVESQEYVFEDRSDDKAVNLITCPDIKLNGTEAARITAIQQAVAGLGTSPAYVIVNGDAVATSLNSGTDFTALLKATSIVSGGIHPVIFSRGNAECRGSVAPNLQKYLPTATGEFYYSVQVGDYTLVNLDMAEDKNDNVGNYGGRVFFDELRQKQIDWIKTLPKGKLVSISHYAPSSTVSRFGLDFETPLKEKGAVLAIGGHSTTHSLEETVDADSIYTIIPGGYNGSANVSVSVLLSGDYAYIKACQYKSGATTYPNTKAVSLSTGKALSISATKPSKVDGVYVLSTPGHIKWLSENCTSASSFSGETFKLANDIDMMLVPFTPIGGNDSVSKDNNTTSKGFSGTFDGNGYSIKNLNIVSSNNNVGFFGVVRNGTVKNLTLSGGMIKGVGFVGGIAGYAYGGTFEDCYSDLTVYSANGSKIGGIAGFLAYGCTVNRCANYGHISTYLAGANVGGIAGQIYSSTKNVISNSFNRGNVALHNKTGVAGGIFGYAGNVVAEVKNCYNAASVTSPDVHGAIFGTYDVAGKLTITNTYFAQGYNGASTAVNNTNAWKTAGGSGTIPSLTQSAMKSQATAQRLNADDFTYIATANDGYPIHKNALHAPGTTGHTYQAVVTAPTCTTNGYTTYTCACGYVTVESIPATGHSYIWDTCSVCGYVDKTYVTPNYYLFGYINGADYASEADYANMGIYRFVDGKLSTAFSVDSYVAVKTEGNGIWYMTNGWQGTDATSVRLYDTNKDIVADKLYIPANTYVTFTLTENADGSLTLSYVPTNCNHTYVQTARTEATCTTDGSVSYHCTTCFNDHTDSIPAFGHKYVWDTCSVCGYVDKNYVPSTYYLFGYINGANYASEEDDQNMGIYKFVNGQVYATFAQDSYVAVKTDGNRIWYMTNGWQGNDVTSVTLYDTNLIATDANKLYIPAKTHVILTVKENPDLSLTLSYETIPNAHSYKAVTVDPTCTEAGYTTYTCTCGDSYTVTIAATGHSYSIKTTAPTCVADGYTLHTCNACSHSYNEVITAIGHKYTAAVTAPTCTADGYTTYTCSNCGHSYLDDTVAATGHKYVNGVCSNCGETAVDDETPIGKLFAPVGSNMTLGSNLDMNFFIDPDDLTGTDYYAEITLYTEDGTVTTTLPYSKWEVRPDYLVVTQTGLAARQMADKIEVVIYHGNGVQASVLWTDCVRSYVMRTLERQNEKAKAMLVDMLNYGAAAQTFFGYNTDDLANNLLSKTQQGYATKTTTWTDQRVQGTGYYGSALTLKDRILLTMYFNNITPDMYAIVSFTDHKGGVHKTRVEGRTFSQYNSSVYGVVVDELVVADGNQLVTVTVYNADGTEIAYANDTINSYAARMMGQDALYEMVSKFTTSAHAYFH